jgi:AcrR family transcriptional regulator
VSHIRLQDVLKQAGLTTGAAYRVWSDQSAFHRDLAVAATRWRDDNPIASTVGAIRHLVDDGAPLREVIRQATGAHVDGLDHPIVDDGRASTPFLTTLALRATASHDADLQAASRARHVESIDSFEELYTMLLAVYHRRMRSPFTLRHLTIAVAALGEGFALQAIEGEPHPVLALPGAGDDDNDKPDDWTLMGTVVWAIVEAMTEPVEPVEPVEP